MDAIHNPRVQLLATALNNLGVGAIIAGPWRPWSMAALAMLPISLHGSGLAPI
jgi:hypothetical protein